MDRVGNSPAEVEFLDLRLARRQRLKLEILASLRHPDLVSSGGGSLSSSDTKSEKKDLEGSGGISGETVILSKSSLENQFYRLLAQYHINKEEDKKSNVEITALKVQHDASRGDMKESGLKMISVREKNKRLRKVLHGLQTRLVASAVILQYEMDRQTRLQFQINSAKYYVETLMDNAMAFYFGQHTADPHIALGGFFKEPVVFFDDGEEEHTAARVRAARSAMIPAHFKAGAQQRRATLRAALARPPALVPPLTGLHSSIDYIALQKYPVLGNFLTPRSAHDTEMSESLNNLATKRVSSKGLKSSLSDKPTKFETPSKKSSGGVFGWLSRPK